MATNTIKLSPGAVPQSNNPNQPLLNELTAIDCRLGQLVDYFVDNPAIPLGDLVLTRPQSSNAMPTGRVMVGTTVTLIRTANANRISILIRNTGSDNLYIGPDNNLTIDEGMEIRPNESWSSETFVGALYGISDGSSLDIRYMEETL